MGKAHPLYGYKKPLDKFLGNKLFSKEEVNERPSGLLATPKNTIQKKSFLINITQVWSLKRDKKKVYCFICKVPLSFQSR